ncbi:MAG: class I SAM-dependent methyltransferase, partial [Chloroflexi bacterium]|nr:class I SAM-dependent methyltransferase [Chloroflexota bacterium]
MADTDKTVGATADGLVVIRSGGQAKKLGLEDPSAAWFVTEDGYRLAQMARQVDAVYEECNLARYMYTSSLLTKLARQYGQMLFLGAGFDCRALWLDGLNDGRVSIYEV